MKTPNPSKKASPKPREGNGETLNRIPENRRALHKAFLEMVNPKKDNPVPSIDNLIKDFANKHPESMIEIDPWNVLEAFAKFYKEQNGVETNKVQPITITKCMCDEPICKCSFFV